MLHRRSGWADIEAEAIVDGKHQVATEWMDLRSRWIAYEADRRRTIQVWREDKRLFPAAREHDGGGDENSDTYGGRALQHHLALRRSVSGSVDRASNECSLGITASTSGDNHQHHAWAVIRITGF